MDGSDEQFWSRTLSTNCTGVYWSSRSTPGYNCTPSTTIRTAGVLVPMKEPARWLDIVSGVQLYLSVCLQPDGLGLKYKNCAYKSVVN